MSSQRPDARTILSRFAAAAADAEGGVPDDILSWNDQAPAGRFAVYRNNIMEGLIGALAARYPVAERLVGRPFFAALGEAFMRIEPPRSPVLLHWGAGLPDFVAAFEPARSVPYLADVMRIESARSRAYHAADAGPLAAASLAGVEPDRVSGLAFVAHPATTVLRSAFPAVTIWEQHQGDGEPGQVDKWNGEDCLVTRPRLQVEVRRLPPGGAVFLEALLQGSTLETAAVAASSLAETFDIAQALSMALEAGAFAGANLAGENR